MKKVNSILSVFLVLFSLFLMACGDEKNPSGEIEKKSDEQITNSPKRYGWVIQLKKEKYEQYKALHANPWPEVLQMIKACNIQNYSIFYRDGYLFSYLEYTGNDFEADMAKMAADSVTQAWWKLTDPCQEPVETAAEGEWWADMEELFHVD
ncbi:L-rhamnose mutarotase [Fulvivirgaceae bacterium BMA10]|uniref:L-rhamnose mutarotase n=1 Tax=Splendidivirga corallicola TaxID=3051826 RepID=A0ABT8KN22_9BACT|nr:L-rhamnose mutarotase [Fulvivirgaceae bacterium BMA10]